MKNKSSGNYTKNRIAQLIIRHLAVIIQHKAKDPRLGMININDVKITGDSSIAKVYVTKINDNENTEFVTLLNDMSGFLRTELANKLTIRSVPELRFYHDQVADTSKRIDELLDKINKQ